MNTDSPLDDLVEEMLVQIPVLVTKEEIADYKAKAELYCHKQVIEELEKIIGNAHTDKGINWWIDLEDVHKRIAELRKTL